MIYPPCAVYKKKSVDFLPILCLIFIINPLCGILFTAFFSIYQKGYNYIKVLIAFIILYLGALNTTKIPESDMVAYLDQYNNVNISGYWKNLSFLYNGIYIKDPGYGTLVFVLYYITFGNQNLFIIAITALTYGFLFAALFKAGKDYKLPKYLIITEILFITFFSQYFNLCWQLVRQQLATAIFFFAMTFKTQSFKTYAVLCAFSLTIHSSMVVIIFMSLIPLLNKKLQFKWIVILSGLAMVLFVTLQSIATGLVSNIALGDGEIGVNVARLSEIEGTVDATADSVSPLFGVIIPLIVTAICFFEMLRKNMVNPLIIHISFLWSIIVISLSFTPFLQYRFFFVIYTILPFVIFLIFKNNQILSRVYCTLVLLVFIMRFYITLNDTFQIASAEEALLLPYFMLIKL